MRWEDLRIRQDMGWLRVAFLRCTLGGSQLGVVEQPLVEGAHMVQCSVVWCTCNIDFWRGFMVEYVCSIFVSAK